MPTNPFDLDSLDLQISPIQGAGDQVEPQTTKPCVAISMLSNLCCRVTMYVCAPIITAAFSCIPGATGCR
jgi:hypothetical protein